MGSFANARKKREDSKSLNTSSAKAETKTTAVEPTETTTSVQGSFQRAKNRRANAQSYTNSLYTPKTKDATNSVASNASSKATNKVSEGEFNRSSAMQSKYGSYKNYLDDKGNTYGDVVKQGAWTGLTGWNSGLAKTADFILPDKITPNFIQKALDYYKQAGDESQEKLNNMADTTGKSIVGNLTSGTVRAIPDMVLSVLSAPTRAVEGISTTSEALKTASEASSISKMLQNAVTKQAKNPMFWTSFNQITGETYEDEISNGATEAQATASALLNGVLGSVIEVGSGIQKYTRPNNLSEALRQWGRQALEEGGEEIAQYSVENLSNMAFGQKDASDINNWFTLDKSKDAVINLPAQLEQGAYGAAIGGILGGQQLVLDTAVNTEENNTLKKDLVNRGATSKEANEVSKIVKKITQGYEVTDKEAEKVANSSFAIDLLNETTDNAIGLEADLKTQIKGLPKYFSTTVKEDSEAQNTVNIKAVEEFSKGYSEEEAKDFIANYDGSQSAMDYIQDYTKWRNAGAKGTMETGTDSLNTIQQASAYKYGANSEEGIKTASNKTAEKVTEGLKTSTSIVDDGIEYSLVKTENGWKAKATEGTTEIYSTGEYSTRIDAVNQIASQSKEIKNVRLQEKQRRFSSQNTTEFRENLGKTAGFNVRNDYKGTPKDTGANRNILGESLKVGAEDSTAKEVTGGFTKTQEEARKLGEAEGVNVVIFHGTIKSDLGYEAEGMTDGKNIYVRGDSPVFTSLQLYKHESTHRWLHRHPHMRNELIDTIRADIGDQQYEALLDFYKERYAELDNEESRKKIQEECGQTFEEYVEEELLCDLASGMNAPKAEGVSAYTEAYKRSEKIADTLKEETRGPPTETLEGEQRFSKSNIKNTEIILDSNLSKEEKKAAVRFSMAKVEREVTLHKTGKGKEDRKGIRVFTISENEGQFASIPDLDTEYVIDTLEKAEKANTNPERIKDWRQFYKEALTYNADRDKTVSVRQTNKLKGITIAKLTTGCQRVNVTLERVHNGILPTTTRLESCYGGTCFTNYGQFMRCNVNLDYMEVKDLTIVSPEVFRTWFKDPMFVAMLNNVPFIRHGEAGDDSHLFGSGVALEWLKCCKEYGVKTKNVFISAAYAPVTEEMYRAYLPYKDLFELHVSNSGWFHKNEIMIRLNEFVKADRVGLNATIRLVTNRDGIDGADMVNQAFIDKWIDKLAVRDKTITEDKILETPYHNDSKGGNHENRTSRPTGKYKNVCCETGACLTCNFKCMTTINRNYDTLEAELKEGRLGGAVPKGVSVDNKPKQAPVYVDRNIPQETIDSIKALGLEVEYYEAPRYSMASDEQRFSKSNVIHTEKQYNDFGWARANDVLTPREYNTFKDMIKDYRYDKRKAANGCDIYAVGDRYGVDNVLIYAKGGIDNFKIDKVVRIDVDVYASNNIDTDIDVIRKEIYDEERKSNTEAVRDVASIYEEEFIIEYTKDDLPTYSVYKGRTKGSGSRKNYRFDTDENGNILTTVFETPKYSKILDEKYIEAINSGDTITAQVMVNEQAEKYGYTKQLFHGTASDNFYVFRVGDEGIHFGTLEQAIQRARVDEGRKREGKRDNAPGRVKSAYVRANNPLTVNIDIGEWSSYMIADVLMKAIRNEKDEYFNHASRDWEEYNPRDVISGIKLTEKDIPELEKVADSFDFEDISNFLESKGIDSIKYMNEYEGEEKDYSYVLFHSNQIKSTKYASYDDNGNLIPLSERFNAKNEDIRFSKAVDSEGNKLTEEQIKYFKNSKVRDENGNLLVLYHGTSADRFDTFENKPLVNGKIYGQGFYFTPNKNKAMSWGSKNVYKVYLNIANPYIISYNNVAPQEVVSLAKAKYAKLYDELSRNKSWWGNKYTKEEYLQQMERMWETPESALSEAVELDKTELNGSEADYYEKFAEAKTRILESLGYDGVIVEDANENITECVVFNSNQIKETTNQNPTSSKSIRFSKVPTYTELAQENTELKNKVKGLSQLVSENAKLKSELLKNVHVEAKSGVYTMANNIIKSYQSTMNVQTANSQLLSIANDMIRYESGQFKQGENENTMFDSIKSKCSKLAYQIISSAEVLRNEESYSRYKELKKYFTVKIKNNIDSKWSEAVELFNLPSDTETVEAFGDTYNLSTTEDKIRYVEDTINNLQPIYENPYTYEMAEATEFLSNEILGKVYTGLFTNTIKKQKLLPDAIIKKYETEIDKIKKANANELKAMIEAHKEEIEKIKNRAAKDKDSSVRSTQRAYEKEIEKHKSEIEKLEEKLDTTKQKNEEKVKKILSEAAAKRKKQAEKVKERDNRKELLTKIERHVKALDKKLFEPTDKNHIPQELQGYAADVLSRIDRSSTRNPFSVNTRDFNKKKELYEEIKARMVIDENFDDNLAEIDSWKYESIYSLSSHQLQTIWNAVRALEAAIGSYNRTFAEGRYQTISDWANKLYFDTKGKNPKTWSIGRNERINKFTSSSRRLLTLDMYTPETYFTLLGEDGYALFRELRNAQDKSILIEEGATEFMDSVIANTGINVHKLKKERVTVKLGNGDISISKSQLMNLYCLVQRGPQAIDHILAGGIDIENPTAKDQNSLNTIKNISMEQITNAFANLSANEVAACNLLQDYLSTTLSAYGNEASMRVYGYKKFSEGNYWPIKVISTEVNKKPTEDSENIVKTWGSKGFTKLTRPSAKQAVLCGDVFDVFAQHVTDMAGYSSYLEVTEDITRIYNYRDKQFDWNVRANVLNQTFGKGGESYLSKLITDICMGSAAEQTYFSGLSSKWKQSAVGGNLRVVVQQPTAILRATDMIDAKYLTNPKNVLKGWEEAKKYAPIAQWKDWGYFDINTGKGLAEIMYGSDGKLDKVSEALMKPAAYADSVSWGLLWNACKKETQDKYPKLKGDDFYKKVAERFTEIVDHTQVVDGILQRSQIMRSKNPINRMATSFMGEPIKSYNMVVQKAYKLVANEGKPKLKAAFNKTVLVYLIASSVNAAVQSLVDAMRDDDKDKKYWEKFFEQLLGDYEDADTLGKWFVCLIDSNLFQANFLPQNVPYAKDVWSIIQGYTVERQDMQGISDVIEAGGNLIKALSGAGKNTIAETLIQFTAELGRLWGLGTSNIKRDVKGLITTIAIESDNYMLQYYLDKFMLKTGYSYNKSEFASIMVNAYFDNDMESYNKIRAELKKEGYTDDYLDGKIDDYKKKNPTSKQQASYDKKYDKITKNKYYKQASESKQEYWMNVLYKNEVGVEDSQTEALNKAVNKEIGFTEQDYILYKLALESFDKPNENGNLGTYTNEEKNAAMDALGFSDAKQHWIYSNFED